MKMQKHHFADKGPVVKTIVFPIVIYGELDSKEDSTIELMLLSCGAGEESWESLGQQGD